MRKQSGIVSLVLGGTGGGGCSWWVNCQDLWVVNRPLGSVRGFPAGLSLVSKAA